MKKVVGLVILVACSSSTTPPSHEPAVSGRLSAGMHHTCVVQNDGSVWCWGRNQYGELGVATPGGSRVPVRAAFSDAIAVTGAMQSTCGIKSDGTVWCWGRVISDTLNYTPTQIIGVSNVTQLAASEGDLCALSADHTASCLTSPTTAMQVATDVVKVTTSCALHSDGTVTCWGDNSYGELGDGTNSGTGPVKVAGLSDVVDIASGYNHNCALRSDDSVWCWGENTAGQLGASPSSTVCAYSNNMWPCRPTAAAVPGLTAKAIFAGENFELALRADGTIAGVGQNNVSQLGGTSAPGCTDPFGENCSIAPVMVPTVSHATLVSAQLSHACAIQADNAVYCWGEEFPPGVTQVPSFTYAP
ncbi:MAG: regulator of chromosome condensation [Myxococcales bacterium]|nr:regulator of chromosome condensation [Myxococcales bacterium]